MAIINDIRSAAILAAFGVAGAHAQETAVRVHIFYQHPAQIQRIIALPYARVLEHSSPGYIDALIPLPDTARLNESGFQWKVAAPDNAQAGGRGGVFGNYYTYAELRQAILNLQLSYPGLAKVDTLAPRSIENRALYVVKVSSSPAVDNGKPQVLFSGAMHAYEPIGPSLCMSDMAHLCTAYLTDPEIRWLVDNRQIYFIPVMNPDGYVYNETYSGRMWRKNRRFNSNGSYGVDLNRNYPYKWGYDNVGSSPNPSAWNYRGTAPASEPETQAVVNFVNSRRIRTWHNHHSPNDVLLIPFGYVNSYPFGDTLVYNTICREECLLYPYQDWGNSYQAYGYVVNGGVEDWAWCDSATYRCYCLVPELGMDYWEGLTDSSLIVSVCQGMLDAELYLIQVAGFYPTSPAISVIDSPPGGNNNGILNPGETARLRVSLKNKAVVDTALDLTGRLATPDPMVRVTDSSGYYGQVIRLATAVNTGDPFGVACSTAAVPGAWVRFDLRLAWNAGDYQKDLACSLQIGDATDAAEKGGRMNVSEALVISPNPVGNVMKITGRMDDRAGIRMYDATGNQVLISRGRRELDLKALPPGVYFVRVRGQDGLVRQQKIIKLE